MGKLHLPKKVPTYFQYPLAWSVDVSRAYTAIKRPKRFRRGLLFLEWSYEAFSCDFWPKCKAIVAFDKTMEWFVFFIFLSWRFLTTASTQIKEKWANHNPNHDNRGLTSCTRLARIRGAGVPGWILLQHSVGHQTTWHQCRRSFVFNPFQASSYPLFPAKNKVSRKNSSFTLLNVENRVKLLSCSC